MFWKSIDSLKKELAGLQATSNARAMELVGRGVDSNRLVEELKPLSVQIVALKNQIRRKTPRTELADRRNSLQTRLKQCPIRISCREFDWNPRLRI
jgi:hypothetical protein